MRQPWAVVTLAQEAFKMTADRRGGGRRSKMARKGGGINQLPWQNVNNTYAPMQLLDEERMEALHRSSMRILSELGIRVMSKRVMSLFEKAGATVDRESRNDPHRRNIGHGGAENSAVIVHADQPQPRKTASCRRQYVDVRSRCWPAQCSRPHQRTTPGQFGGFREFHEASAPFQRHTRARQSGLRSPRTAGQFRAISIPTTPISR